MFPTLTRTLAIGLPLMFSDVLYSIVLPLIAFTIFRLKVVALREDDLAHV